MPDNFSKILGNQSGNRPTAGGTSLPPSGSVVMATVDEDLGEGTYSLRWAGNRVTVSSRATLNRGETLILKSEVSPEGKPILVVQGPALPSVQAPLIRNVYSPTYHKPNNEDKSGGIAASSQPVKSGGGVQPGTTLLLLLLEELPNADEQVLTLLASAEEELDGAADEGDGDAAATTDKEGGKKGEASASGSGTDKASRPAAGRPGASNLETPQNHPPEHGQVDPEGEAPGQSASTKEAVSDQKHVPSEASAGRSPQTRPADRAGASQGSQASEQAAANNARPTPTPEGDAVVPPRDRPAARGEAPPAAIPDDQPAAGQTRPAADSSGAAAVSRHDRYIAPGEVPHEAKTADVPAADRARPAPAPSGDAVVAPRPDPVSHDEAPRDNAPNQPAAPASREASRHAGETVIPDQARSAAPPAAPGESIPLPADRSAANGVRPEAVPAAPADAIQPRARPDASAEPAASVPPTETTRPDKPADATAAQPDQPAGGPGGAALADALEQIAKLSTLPLGGGLDRLDVGRMGAVPEAIADRAASILLNAAGLTPGAATLEAAKALMRYNVPIDRQIIQTLLALTAGAEEGDRTALLQAAARLAADEIPLAAPLAGGLADIIARKESIGLLLGKTIELLNPEAMPGEAQPLVDTAGKLLKILTVDLGRADAALSLERFVSTLGREALGNAAALVENAAQTQLENHPVLPKIDQALAAIIGILEEGAGTAAPTGNAGSTPNANADAGQTAPTTNSPVSPLPGGALPGPTGQEQPATTPGAAALPPAGDSGADQPPAPAAGQPAAPPPASPGQAAAPPSAASAGQSTAPAPTPAASAGQSTTPAPTPGQTVPLEMADGPTAEQTRYQLLDRNAAAAPGFGTRHAAEVSREAAKAVVDQVASSVLEKLKSIFQLPGVNDPEVELLRPAGVLDRFLAGTGDRSANAANREESERLLNDLLSPDREKANAALRELPGKDRAVLREMATRLNDMERQILRNDPAISRLADAANSLRDLGRQLLAVKAENLAGMDREPGVMLAEVPFKLNDQGGDGRMQMFYRRSKAQKGGWTARVILDLNTTNMGPVLGDMRFFGQDMVLNLFVGKTETAEYLAQAAADLTEALLGKGFRLKAKFLVLPPPPPRVETSKDDQITDGDTRSEQAVEAPRRVPARRRGRLDTKA